jgi:hypothetical protein
MAIGVFAGLEQAKMLSHLPLFGSRKPWIVLVAMLRPMF